MMSAALGRDCGFMSGHINCSAVNQSKTVVLVSIWFDIGHFLTLSFGILSNGQISPRLKAAKAKWPSGL
jgi:hypothetical protein